MRPSFFLALLALVLISSGSLAYAALEEACKEAAASSPNVGFEFCVASLQADPRSDSADAKGLAVIATTLASSNVTATSAKAEALQASSKDRLTKECLTTCQSVYDEMASTLKDSIEALNSGAYADANTYLSAALDQPDTCEQSFSELGRESLLKKENQDLTGLSSIALAFAAALG